MILVFVKSNFSKYLNFHTSQIQIITNISVFERIPNIGPNRIPKYYLQEQIDRIKYQIIQTLLFE